PSASLGTSHALPAAIRKARRFITGSLRPPGRAASGQTLLGREIDDAPLVVEEHRAREDEEALGALCGHRGEGAGELIGAPRLHEPEPHPQPPGRSLRFLHHVSGRALAEGAQMPEGGNAGRFGERLLEESQALGNELGTEERQSRDVPARFRQALYEAVAEGIAHAIRHSPRVSGDWSGLIAREPIRGAFAGGCASARAHGTARLPASAARKVRRVLTGSPRRRGPARSGEW